MNSSNPAVWAGIEAPEGLELAWRAVHPDGRSRNGFRWPFKGTVKVPAKGILRHRGPCPKAEGDGLCLAKTWDGAASGGIPAITGLVAAYHVEDVLGQDEHKLRVRKCRVIAVLDIPRLIREGHAHGANLTGANLTGANLTEANLTEANLTGANLTGANLTEANLTEANLTEANLTRANLTRANLAGANLAGANLTGANLTGANLTRASLTEANLTRANLTRANLAGANLTRASLAGANLTRAINVPSHVNQS